MKITVGMFTARDDYSIIGFPRIHQFEYLMSSLRRQSHKDFEVVIADVFYDSRADYFEKNPEDFPVKHVPIKPNVWNKRDGVWAISTARNTCLLHATGDAVMLIGDCTSLQADCLRNADLLLRHYEGVYTAYEVRVGDDVIGVGIRPNDTIGYGHPGLTLRTEVYERLNGYDEMFDGSKGYEDSDMLARLKIAGVDELGFNSCLMYCQKHTAPFKTNVIARCVNLWLKCATERVKQGVSRANEKPITGEEFEFIKGECPHYKEGICSLFHVACPDERWKNKDLPEVSVLKEIVELYKHPSLIFNLSEQRKDVEAAIKKLKELVD